ncbi:MAG: Spy/CpxP family protein refolding chaperone [Bacteroidales bacterium]|nr:Spy/CpxP family protein refolding chaperone [Bacteroidales bacterium]
MKRFLFIVAIFSIVNITPSISFAQASNREGRHHEQKEKIENIITDLTPQQKSKIDVITQRSSKNVEGYRKQLKAVRDSIRLFMDSRVDNSSKVFPLYEREGRLQAELSKEYYRTKVAIDAILTPEQFARFQQHMKSKHAKHAKKEKFASDPKNSKAPREEFPKSRRSQK